MVYELVERGLTESEWSNGRWLRVVEYCTLNTVDSIEYLAAVVWNYSPKPSKMKNLFVDVCSQTKTRKMHKGKRIEMTVSTSTRYPLFLFILDHPKEFRKVMHLLDPRDIVKSTRP